MTTTQQARELANHFICHPLSHSTIDYVELAGGCLRSLAIQVEDLTTQNLTLFGELQNAMAERDAYRADAELMAWIRAQYRVMSADDILEFMNDLDQKGVRDITGIRAAIDAARKEAP